MTLCRLNQVSYAVLGTDIGQVISLDRMAVTGTLLKVSIATVPQVSFVPVVFAVSLKIIAEIWDAKGTIAHGILYLLHATHV